jgi:hypothetical protein
MALIARITFCITRIFSLLYAYIIALENIL